MQGSSEVGVAKVISASGNVKATSGFLLGIIVSSTSSGVLAFYDDAATGTTTKIIDNLTPSAGNFIRLPIAFANGLNVVLVSGTISCTVVYV